MRVYKRFLEIVFFMNIVFFSLGAAQVPYDIQITTYGEDALVQAIQRYSNLTKADVDRWKFSWAPFVGDYIRSSMIEKISNLVKACQSLVFVHYWFQKSSDLLARLPAHWNITRVCLALKNVEKQAEYALALLSQLGTLTEEEKQWKILINIYIKYIQHNKQLLGCVQLQQTQQTKDARKLQIEKDRQEFNKLYWKSFAIKWKMAKDVSQSAFKGTQWLLQTMHQNSAPLLSAATLWFMYNKIFGLSSSK